MKKETIGIIPVGGYRGRVNQSLIALAWLEEIDEELNGRLEYKCSSRGERKVAGRFVDGFHEPTNTVYQFHGCFYHGCFYHGCTRCYDPYEVNQLSKEKFTNLYAKTTRFTHVLRDVYRDAKRILGRGNNREKDSLLPVHSVESARRAIRWSSVAVFVCIKR